MDRVIVCAVTLLAAGVRGQETFEPSGHWLLQIGIGGDPAPFRLSIVPDDPIHRAVFLNGVETVEAPAVWDGERLTIPFGHYDSRLVMHRAPTQESPFARSALGGFWEQREGAARIPVTMKRQEILPPPGPTSPASHAADRFAGRWRIRSTENDDQAVGIFYRPFPGSSDISGTVLTTSGDLRHLHGRTWRDGLELRSFDGCDARRFWAGLKSDGTLDGLFHRTGAASETWTAVRDPAAALPDALAEVRTLDGAGIDRLTFPDLAGRPVALGGPDLSGAPRIVHVFGSWSSNSHDAAPLLVELDRRHRDRGLRIVGLACEPGRDPARDVRQVRRYASRHDVRFLLLLAGTDDREKAAAALGVLDRIKAFPTTLFVRRDGSVHAVWSGFLGPAAGVEHVRLRERWEALTEDILAP